MYRSISYNNEKGGNKTGDRLRNYIYRYINEYHVITGEEGNKTSKID